MGLKVKLLPSGFKVPSCTQHPKTTSFRLTATMKDDIFKTINSVYLDHESDCVETTPDSWFTNNSSELEQEQEQEESLLSGDGDGDAAHLEEIVRGAQQQSSCGGDRRRLLFDSTAPHQDSPRLCGDDRVGYKESVAMCVESQDPYEDFKRSMWEMVESLKVRDDWEELEELLGWYLKVNARKHHGFIISAFIDLLAQISITDSTTTTTTSSSEDSSSEANSDQCQNDEIVTTFCSAASSLISSSSASTSEII